MTIKSIAVVGAGTMGNGIAQVCATAGYEVRLIDVAPAALDKGIENIRRSLAKLTEKGRLSAERAEAALAAIAPAGELAAAAGADLVIEAATENPELKLKIFRELDGLAHPEAILASNTSSISLTKIAGATRRPDKVVGMHFMNPVPLMTLVEVIRALGTSDATVAAI
ncbi:MAG: 3-hydroxyacyl-CoA dehydrogenase NAD-binding domain-containing protein, partial [Anaerolineales bacterium]